jgi:hypothetical protein
MVMDIQSKLSVPITVSLPEAESNGPITWITPEVSKHYFNFFSSRCHHLPHAPRGLQLPRGTASAVSCRFRGYQYMVPVRRSGTGLLAGWWQSIP